MLHALMHTVAPALQDEISQQAEAWLSSPLGEWVMAPGAAPSMTPNNPAGAAAPSAAGGAPAPAADPAAASPSAPPGSAAGGGAATSGGPWVDLGAGGGAAAAAAVGAGTAGSGVPLAQLLRELMTGAWCAAAHVQ